jgi:DNA repair exonuclease SbcCD ATPase subunit
MTKALSLGRILAAALAALALAGCAREKEPKKEVDPLTAAINALPEGPVRSLEEVSAARARNAEMQATLDEVQNALEDLRAKELRAIKTSIAIAQEGKVSTGTRETLKAEIEDIRKAVRANLEKLDALERVNRASGERVAALERLVRELHRQFEEKEETIAALEEKTRELTQTAEGLRGTVKEKEQAVEQMRTVLADREAQLAAAYVLIAPRGALQRVGLVERKGSVLGLGGSWQRTGQLDETLFRRVDIRKVRAFDVAALPGKALILSDHPKDSYTLAAVSPTESTLTVKDAGRFWKMSRQLIVMLPD